MMQHFTIDLTGVTTDSQLHDRLIEGLDLPDYYGRNLDAFWDCLGDLSGDVEIVVVNAHLVENAGQYMDMLLEYQDSCPHRISVVFARDTI